MQLWLSEKILELNFIYLPVCVAIGSVFYYKSDEIFDAEIDPFLVEEIYTLACVKLTAICKWG